MFRWLRTRPVGRLFVLPVVLAASASAPAALVPSTNAIHFGTALAGADGGVADVQLSNQSTQVAHVSGLSLVDQQTGARSADFVQSNDCGRALQPAERCTVRVKFAPRKRGTREASLLIRADNSFVAAVRLDGAGDAGVLELVASDLRADPAELREVVARNTGTRPVRIAGVMAVGPDGERLLQNNDCGRAVAGGSSCRVRFLDTARLDQASTVVISTASGARYRVVVPPVTHVTDGGPIHVAERSVDFGRLPVPGAASHVLAFRNDGPAPVRVRSMAIVGDQQRVFHLFDECRGTAIASRGACSVMLTAQVTNTANGRGLLVAQFADAPAVRVPLSVRTQGAPVLSDVGAFPAALDFGFTLPEQPRRAKLRFTNLVDQLAKVTSVVVSDKRNFKVLSQCESPFALRASCDVDVEFHPRGQGRVAATVSAVLSNGQVVRVPVSGEGPVPSAQVTAMPLSGADDDDGGYILWNNGSDGLALEQVSVSPGYLVASNDCPATLPVGALCSVRVRTATAGGDSATPALRVELYGLSPIEVPLSHMTYPRSRADIPVAR